MTGAQMDLWHPLPLAEIQADSRAQEDEDYRREIRELAQQGKDFYAYDVLPEGQRRWFVGPYGWLVDDVQVLAQPVPCRGFQKLWRLPEAVREAVEEQQA